MSNDTPHFDDRGRLIAPKYDDVYFSAEDGLAETRHVFLQGNRLAARFAELHHSQAFTIAETGFGTGLNFLAAWQCFEASAPADAQLHFVSVEGLPLDQETMSRSLSPWPELERYREALLAQWGPLWPSTHRFRFADGRVRLTLLVDEVAEVLSKANFRGDAWFLDGFAPSRNPAMWSEAVFQQVARCSGTDTTLATYTAAGFVRRGLQAVGFEIEKQPGFGTKRDMTVGRRVDASEGRGSCRADEQEDAAARQEPRLPQAEKKSAIVIGGSLAGAFVARSLAERGVAVTVLEAQRLVNGELPTLSPRVAVLQPKINNIDDAAGRWLREGYSAAERWLAADTTLAKRCRWRMCGTFQAAYDERAERRLRRFVQQFGETGLCQWIEPEQTKTCLGVPLPCGGVLIERAGTLHPAGLCVGLLNHPNITIQDNTQVISLERSGEIWSVFTVDKTNFHTQTLVIANALDAKRLEPTQHLDLKPVRGQVTLFPSRESETGESGLLSTLRRALFFGGYVLPAADDAQTLGASFIPGDSDTQWRDAEHIGVCDKIARILPDEADRLRRCHSPTGWVGLRTTTPTHRCYAERIGEGLYVSIGHGSHGIASAAAAGEHLASLIVGTGTLRVAR